MRARYNDRMNDRHLFQFERQVESTIEGLFDQLLGHPLRAPRPQELALAIGRAMESGVRHDANGQLAAPERYTISLYPAYVEQLNQLQLVDLLISQIGRLASFHGYHLEKTPQVAFQASPSLSAREIHVEASFIEGPSHSTVAMEPVPAAAPAIRPNAHLLINDAPFALSSTLTTIGRSRDNNIVLEDAYASRHHAQIRLRAGIYTLFDTQSGSGTLINGVEVKEHRLQSGDVIRIGRTTLVYIDSTLDDIDMTDAFEPEL